MLFSLIALALAAATPSAHPVPPAPPRASVYALPAALPPVLDEAKWASVTSARRFAALYMPEGVTKASAKLMFRRAFRQAADRDPSTAALEKKFPGAMEAAVEAGLDVVDRAIARDLPESQDAVAQLVRQRMTDAEMAALITYYEHPATQRLLADTAKTLDFDAFAARLENDPASRLHTSDIVDSVVPSAIANFQTEDLPRTTAFMTSPAGRKFGQLGPALLTVVTERTNAMMQTFNPEVQAAVLSALKAHLAKSNDGKRP